jgi:hypothetical protein
MRTPVTDEERDQAYDSAPEVVRFLWASPESGERLRSIFSKHGLSEEVYRPYALTVGDVILGFYKQSELPQLLKSALGVDDVKAIRLTADLLDFLAPLNGEEAKTTHEVPTIANEIAQTEAALAHVSSVRTMARDMEDLKSQAPHEALAYQSSQDSLRPSTQKPSDNRWGNEE